MCIKSVKDEYRGLDLTPHEQVQAAVKHVDEFIAAVPRAMDDSALFRYVPPYAKAPKISTTKGYLEMRKNALLLLATQETVWTRRLGEHMLEALQQLGNDLRNFRWFISENTKLTQVELCELVSAEMRMCNLIRAVGVTCVRLVNGLPPRRNTTPIR